MIEQKLDTAISESPYRQHLMANFFNYCNGQRVLEIAPLHGFHSELIVLNNPKSLTLVEPDPESTEILKIKFPAVEVFCDDIFNFYKKDYEVDVVVCCGLLYHLHSPLHLLELIVNRSRPKLIIVDNTCVPNETETSCSYGYEFSNRPGNRFSSSKHIAKFNCTLPYNIMKLAFRDMEYSEQLIDKNLVRFGISEKTGFMAVYRRAYHY